jgi:hypothetical protein
MAQVATRTSHLANPKTNNPCSAAPRISSDQKMCRQINKNEEGRDIPEEQHFAPFCSRQKMREESSAATELIQLSGLQLPSLMCRCKK